MHAIAGNLSPVQRGGGIEVLEADTFRLQCLQTATGLFLERLYFELWLLKIADVLMLFTALKFFVVADPSHPNLDAFLQSVYNLYIDYALKVR